MTERARGMTAEVPAADVKAEQTLAAAAADGTAPAAADTASENPCPYAQSNKAMSNMSVANIKCGSELTGARLVCHVLAWYGTLTELEHLQASQLQRSPCPPIGQQPKTPVAAHTTGTQKPKQCNGTGQRHNNTCRLLLDGEFALALVLVTNEICNDLTATRSASQIRPSRQNARTLVTMCRCWCSRSSPADSMLRPCYGSSFGVRHLSPIIPSMPFLRHRLMVGHANHA